MGRKGATYGAENGQQMCGKGGGRAKGQRLIVYSEHAYSSREGKLSSGQACLQQLESTRM